MMRYGISPLNAKSNDKREEARSCNGMISHRKISGEAFSHVLSGLSFKQDVLEA
ncbi:hypothetical protein Xinn_03489 [Xenorhabdus innexi]|uniref:Transposase n=1 Tax=Xenorhabdus innexi TaxID=290109 RepID=A0A2G0N650_9GAMM|nr:hypothetical protein Xinn_03489 [Xenorhabdus innexi]